MRVRSGAIVAIAIAVTWLSACGGGGSETGTGEAGGGACERLASESAREDCERAEAAAHVPAADRVAYYQLATTVGLLRSAAVAEVRGDPPPPTARSVELRDARTRVALTRPRDRDLKRVRHQLLPLLGPAVTGLDSDQARTTLTKIRLLEGSLASYLRREPANASLLPD